MKMDNVCSRCSLERRPEFFRTPQSRWCIDCIRKYRREWMYASYRRNPEKHRERNRNYRNANIEKARETSRKSREKARMDALNAYSSGKLCCACCGEATVQFLAIDHIYNDGYKYRKNGKNNKGGSSMGYSRLRRLGFPDKDRLQVLCHNCNLAKGFYGKCPHNN